MLDARSDLEQCRLIQRNARRAEEETRRRKKAEDDDARERRRRAQQAEAEAEARARANETHGAGGGFLVVCFRGLKGKGMDLNPESFRLSPKRESVKVRNEVVEEGAVTVGWPPLVEDLFTHVPPCPESNVKCR